MEGETKRQQKQTQYMCETDTASDKIIHDGSVETSDLI